jgi:hypothetical protein
VASPKTQIVPDPGRAPACVAVLATKKAEVTSPVNPAKGRSDVSAARDLTLDHRRVAPSPTTAVHKTHEVQVQSARLAATTVTFERAATLVTPNAVLDRAARAATLAHRPGPLIEMDIHLAATTVRGLLVREGVLRHPRLNPRVAQDDHRHPAIVPHGGQVTRATTPPRVIVDRACRHAVARPVARDRNVPVS